LEVVVDLANLQVERLLSGGSGQSEQREQRDGD
jgi:hypothetical protein